MNYKNMLEYLRGKKIYGNKLDAPEITRVIKIINKNNDDEYGTINEHYVVTYEIRANIHNNVFKKQTCLVNKASYKSWEKEKKSVILLNQDENE